jgi:hypothetical protein
VFDGGFREMRKSGVGGVFENGQRLRVVDVLVGID